MIKSPTVRLLLGLLVTLAAVTGFCFHSLQKLSDLRTLQTQRIDLDRHDSLLLLRVQNDVNALGLKLQEMTEGKPVANIAQYRWSFARLRGDLNNAIEADLLLVRHSRRVDLNTSIKNFWATWDRAFLLASNGHESAARTIAAQELSTQQMDLARQTSELLEDNNLAEERADVSVGAIYDGAERSTYLFLAATIAAILFTSLYLIYSNRRIFERMTDLSGQRRILAARLITVQEEVLRSVSRELHDEFGQILTAVSTMLLRAERKGLPADSPFRTELTEVREITHTTLEKMRSLSQMLHPAMLDDYGLEKAIEWYCETFERQSSITTRVCIVGQPQRITGQAATHSFRIVQEALTNVARHSGAKTAEVEMIFAPNRLTINTRDFGHGMPPAKKNAKPGLGVIAMRERAEILNGNLTITSVPNTGTTVSLSFPLHQDDPVREIKMHQEIGEVLT